jgi:uncharacterized protein (DUF2252 family)
MRLGLAAIDERLLTDCLSIGAPPAQRMDWDARKQRQKVLKQNRSKKFDAPSWLWTSIVQLVARHESAYLEHCRQYVLNAAPSR